MVKKVVLAMLFMVYSIVIGGHVFAQDSISHLEFKGIPINGKIDNFVNKLETQGFRITEKLDDIVMMKGQFTGKDATIYIISTKKSKTVWKVVVEFSEQSSWFSLKSDYNYYKEMFVKKYGIPTDNYEFFSKPYYEGDGYELSALRNGKCHYISAFETKSGVVYLEISKFKKIKINYEDETNSNIMNREKEESVIDDI